MKNIGILSFHRAINYGGVLQVYALQQTVFKINKNCEVIDYRSPYIEKLYYKSPLLNYKGIKRIIYVLLKNGPLKFNTKVFQGFVSRHIIVSENIYKVNDLSLSISNYDVFITGSDQVWSYDCAGFDKNYFLDFVPDIEKKYSYAASFGSGTIPDNYTEKYRNYLKNYNQISVREESGKKYIENRLHLEARTHLDPTLLLTLDEWKRIAQKPKVLNKVEKFILIYMISPSKKLINYAKSYALNNNLKIVYINDNLYKAKGVINAKKLTPEEFIYLFQKANYVLTNSFHGIVFSLNFNKSFLVELLKTNKKINARITDVLSLFELDELIIDNFNNLDFIDVNFENVNRKLTSLRKDSIDYISNIVGV